MKNIKFSSFILNTLIIAGAFYSVVIKSILGLILFIYLLPLVLNGIMYILSIRQKNNAYNRKWSFYFLPSLSLVAYIVFGFLMKLGDFWSILVEYTHYINGGFSIELTDILSAGSIIFVVILLYGAQFLFYLIYRKGETND